MVTVFVNGAECKLDWSVGWLDYHRVVKLSGMPYREDYDVTYLDVDNFRLSIGSGTFPTEGMRFSVEKPPPSKPWWRWLWPE